MKFKFALSTFFSAMLVAALLFAFATHAEVTPHRTEVTAKRFAFAPGEITLKKGEPVVLVLKSVDVPARHPHQGAWRRGKSGQKARAAKFHLLPIRPETFVGHCSVFCGSGHGTMALTVHVVGLTACLVRSFSLLRGGIACLAAHHTVRDPDDWLQG